MMSHHKNMMYTCTKLSSIFTPYHNWKNKKFRQVGYSNRFDYTYEIFKTLSNTMSHKEETDIQQDAVYDVI